MTYDIVWYHVHTISYVTRKTYCIRYRRFRNSYEVVGGVHTTSLVHIVSDIVAHFLTYDIICLVYDIVGCHTMSYQTLTSYVGILYLMSDLRYLMSFFTATPCCPNHPGTRSHAVGMGRTAPACNTSSPPHSLATLACTRSL